MLECAHHTHPHVIFDLASTEDEESDEQASLILQLKLGEIKSIIRIMRIAMEREYNRECLVVPVSSFSLFPSFLLLFLFSSSTPNLNYVS